MVDNNEPIYDDEMQHHGRIRFTTVTHVSVGSVRAPACPIGARATWTQVLVSFAGIPLFITLVTAALAQDPPSFLGAGLAIIGLASSLFVFVGVLRSQHTTRGASADCQDRINPPAGGQGRRR